MGAGVVVSALLVLEIVSLMHPDKSKVVETLAQNAAKPAASLNSSTGQNPITQTFQAASAPPPVVKTNNSIPSNATSTPDASLLRLSTMVSLAEARDHEPNKTQWAEAVANAQTLLQGPCDCGQRNWLNHFIEMGNYALSNSGEYYKSAQLMATMPRNDDQAMALSRRSN